MTVAPWQIIADQFKARLDKQIPAEWRLNRKIPANARNLVQDSGILSDKELELLKLDATGLQHAIVARKYTSVEATTAYLKAAAIAHQALNCLTDFFPAEALERAAQLDEILEKTGKPVGPYHGVPISIKDHLGVKGHEITAGFSSWVGKVIPETDGVLVAALRSAGAVFYVKTTNPQAIMHLETDSFLGPTLNPYNRLLTAGGSSGGEGALIGIGASPIGVGTDIGGSIRNPAAVNGIYGFKATSLRLPKAGNFSALGGQEAIAGAIGPMARSARDMTVMTKTILDSQPWKVDPVVINMPFCPDEVKWINGSKPKIGVMWDDGVVKPQPPARRALESSVKKLREAGYEVVDFAPYKTAEAWELFGKLLFTDGGERVKQALLDSGETALPLTEWIMSFSRPLTAIETCELVVQRDRFRAQYLAHWYKADIDILISVPGPGPAPVLGTSKYWSYTSFFNLVDYPSGVLPTGDFVGEEDVADAPREYWSTDDKEVSEAYSPETFMGTPLSLQVIAPRWEDEKVLKAIELIDTVLHPED